jgi:hypothetical protein
MIYLAFVELGYFVPVGVFCTGLKAGFGIGPVNVSQSQ